MRKRRLAVLAVLWTVAFVMMYTAFGICVRDRGYSEVIFADVGEADAALITTRHRKAVLIDGGDVGAGENTLSYLMRANSVDCLDAVFVSHMHRDHMSGVIELIEMGFPIERVYVSKLTEIDERLQSVAESRGVPISKINGGFVEVDGVTFTVLNEGIPDTSDENDLSLILRMDYGENSFLFTGDSGKPQEKELIQEGDCDVDFIKVAHHGSSSSTGGEFIESVTPKLAVISAGEDNLYGHPSHKTLKTLKNNNVPVLRTDRDGTITVTMTEDDIKNITTSR